MEGIATVTQDWWLRGPLDQWRRTTGVLRAHLMMAPLPAWMAPNDVERLLTLGELARYRDAVGELDLGYWGRRVRARVELSRWLPSGTACLYVRALEPLPLSAWWLPWTDFAECPPLPHT